MFGTEYWKIPHLFTSNRKEVTRNGKKRQKILRTISCRWKYINGAKFMASSLSNFVNNLAEGIHKIKCKYEHDKKNMERARLYIKIVSIVLNIKELKII